MDKGDIKGLFDEWNSALQTGEPKKVAALYASDAILLPTVSNKVRHNHDEIEDYFVHFLARGPQGEIDESNVRIPTIYQSILAFIPLHLMMVFRFKHVLPSYTAGMASAG